MNRSTLQQVRHLWHIIREVLRGFTAGQPPDEERPRKSCC